MRYFWTAAYMICMLLSLPFLAGNMLFGSLAGYCYPRTFPPETTTNKAGLAGGGE